MLLDARHHPGEAFLEALDERAAVWVEEGRRGVWALTALASFGWTLGSGAGGGLLADALGSAFFSGRHRMAALPLAQLAAALWAMAAAGEPPTASTSTSTSTPAARAALLPWVERVACEVCARLEGGGGRDGGEGQGQGQGEVGEDECSVDALGVHARLRQAGEWLREGAAVRGSTAERLLFEVQRWGARCFDEGEAAAGGFAAAMAERLAARGWRAEARAGPTQPDVLVWVDGVQVSHGGEGGGRGRWVALAL
jgi:hypothetical protein